MLKRIDTQDLQNAVETVFGPHLFFHDCHEHIDTDGNPNLDLDRIVAEAVKVFDPQVLLDPFEEQLHLPAALIESGDGQGGKGEVVGQEDQTLAGVGIHIMDASEFVGVMADARKIAQPDDLITAHASRGVHGARFQSVELEIGFGAGDKEGGGQDKAVEPLEIQVTAIHHIKGTGLQQQFIQDADIGLFALGNGDERGDGPAQIQQRMQFDRRLGAAKTRPGKQVQTQVDGRGIQGVDGFVEFGSDRFIGVEDASAPDQRLGQIAVDTPVALTVGVGQGAAGNFAANTQVIELLTARAQTGFHVAETLPESELAKGHAKKLVPAGERFHFIVAAIAPHTAAELLRVNQVSELSENELSGIHPWSLANDLLDGNRRKSSSRSHPATCANGRKTLTHSASEPVNTRTVVILRISAFFVCCPVNSSFLA